ncbi:hypothetical protein M0802_003066 [Mischocyttarus mexicanus]|nr:hypothetical protein M0802_003066 [Mischocyttarus mexicanus]
MAAAAATTVTADATENLAGNGRKLLIIVGQTTCELVEKEGGGTLGGEQKMDKTDAGGSLFKESYVRAPNDDRKGPDIPKTVECIDYYRIRTCWLALPRVYQKLIFSIGIGIDSSSGFKARKARKDTTGSLEIVGIPMCKASVAGEAVAATPSKILREWGRKHNVHYFETKYVILRKVPTAIPSSLVCKRIYFMLNTKIITRCNDDDDDDDDNNDEDEKEDDKEE